ncbi:hypothetical protein [Dyella sp.]|uniref:hypothetical protein n=1 Tax=Dyella sp. TaxID=1869338 RepID=UPI002FDA4E18
MAEVYDELESRRASLRKAGDEERRLDTKVLVDEQMVVRTEAAVRETERRLQAAMSLHEHLISEYAFANPDDAAG